MTQPARKPLKTVQPEPRVSASLLGGVGDGPNGGNPRPERVWSGRRESNPHRQLGRLELYH